VLSIANDLRSAGNSSRRSEGNRTAVRNQRHTQGFLKWLSDAGSLMLGHYAVCLAAFAAPLGPVQSEPLELPARSRLSEL